MAFFWALGSVLLRLVLREKRLRWLLLSFASLSARGSIFSSDESLVSRFRPGITVWLALRNKAMVAAGP